MVFNLKNKVAAVTGGGSGIGQAIAKCFASQGATVAVIEINTSSAQETLDAIRRVGGDGAAYICNVANQDEVDAAIQKIANDKGSIDILVNSAGIAHIATAETTSEKDFDRIFQ